MKRRFCFLIWRPQAEPQRLNLTNVRRFLASLVANPVHSSLISSSQLLPSSGLDTTPQPPAIQNNPRPTFPNSTDLLNSADEPSFGLIIAAVNIERQRALPQRPSSSPKLESVRLDSNLSDSELILRAKHLLQKPPIQATSRKRDFARFTQSPS
jgi:hypothetical protein